MKGIKGYSMVQVLMVISISLICILSVMGIFKKDQENKNVETLSQNIAFQSYEFTKALDQYVKDNSTENIREDVTIQKLIDEGYLSKESVPERNDIGLYPIGKISSPHGFTQSIGTFLEGNIDKKEAEKYGLLDESGEIDILSMQSMFMKSGLIVSDMDVKMLPFTLKRDGDDDKISRSYSGENDSIYEYYDKSRIKNDNKISFAIFTNLQKEPGYLVLRYYYYYPSHKFGGPSGQYQKVDSMGYSDYCPSPGINTFKKGSPPLNVVLDNGNINNGYFKEKGDINNIGDLSGSYYVCLPATKAIVDNNKKSISITSMQYNQSNLACTNTSRKNSGIKNVREYTTINANTYAIGPNKYSVVIKGSSYDTNCESNNSGETTMTGLFMEGSLPIKINISESNKYKDSVNNVSTQNINLN